MATNTNKKGSSIRINHETKERRSNVRKNDKLNLTDSVIYSMGLDQVSKLGKPA